MTCRDVAAFMMEYLAGELREPVARRFDAHLKICPNCVRYLANYKAAVELGRQAFRDECEDASSAGIPDELVRAILHARRVE